MKYVEIVKAVREKQMKKEANLKKLAGLLKIAAPIRYFYPAGIWDTGIKQTDPKEITSEEVAKKILQAPEPKISPVNPEKMHPLFRSILGEKGLVKVTPPEHYLPSYYSTKGRLKEYMDKYKQFGNSQTWDKYFTVDPRKWVK